MFRPSRFALPVLLALVSGLVSGFASTSTPYCTADDLLDAVRVGDAARVRTLLEGGLNPNVRDSKGFTPLHIAVIRGDADVVRLLLEAHAYPDALDAYGRTPLHLGLRDSATRRPSGHYSRDTRTRTSRTVTATPRSTPPPPGATRTWPGRSSRRTPT